ncbi:MAG: MarR family winged helix-turn-helix transcriptional regulator [Solirubrobacteraceae bacterium]
MQVTDLTRAAHPASLATDLYAVVVFLHKNCNADLFEAVGELDLSLTQIKVLHHLEEADERLTLGRLAELIPVSLPAASRTVEDLVRRGFVRRHEDAADRRMKRMAVTDAGRSITLRLNAARRHGLQRFTESLSGPERAALAQALGVLMAREDVLACRPETDR